MAMKFEKKAEGDFFLDVTGYVCPHPQLYTKKALEKMREGDVLEVVFDNPSSAESIAAMCDTMGDDIIERIMEKGTYRWKIKKTESG
ncbi:MAG: sulfurtransferase TusA family protein [Candidatus Rokubacteria bacterium]|nr:sulfurtransferase TusA family protein [Candidatus Rokubacteria bacterium]